METEEKKQAVKEWVENEVLQAEAALQLGKYLDPYDEMVVKIVTEKARKDSEIVLWFLQRTLLNWEKAQVPKTWK